MPWKHDGAFVGDGGRVGDVYACALCHEGVVKLPGRGDPDDVRFAVVAAVVGARAHVRLHLATKAGSLGAFLGNNVMEKHEAEAFERMVRKHFNERDTTIRACGWCGDNICSAEGATGDKCSTCEADFKAGKAEAERI